MTHYTKNGKEWDAHQLEDGTWCNAKPKAEAAASQHTSWVRPDKVAPKEEKVDWDAVNRGKVKHGLVVAVIEKEGLTPFVQDEIATKQIIEDLADYIMAN
jgi:hypothetical protein